MQNVMAHAIEINADHSAFTIMLTEALIKVKLSKTTHKLKIIKLQRYPFILILF
jgi:hypothetical protein